MLGSARLNSPAVGLALAGLALAGLGLAGLGLAGLGLAAPPGLTWPGLGMRTATGATVHDDLLARDLCCCARCACLSRRRLAYPPHGLAVRGVAVRMAWQADSAPEADTAVIGVARGAQKY
jgi:hypothetical protein